MQLDLDYKCFEQKNILHSKILVYAIQYYMNLQMNTFSDK